MSMLKRVVIAGALSAAVSATAAAQPPSGGHQQSPPPPAPPSTDVQTRPATTTFMGDTGLWNVPTADVLPARRWSVSAYRVNFDTTQGFQDISRWPVTFGVGLGDRAEIF